MLASSVAKMKEKRIFGNRKAGNRRSSLASADSVRPPENRLVEATLCLTTENQTLISLDKKELLDASESHRSFIVLRRWKEIVGKICKSNNWARLRRVLKHLPYDINQIYNEVEAEKAFKFSKQQKQLFYAEFKKATSCFKSALAFDSLHCAEVEYLIKGLPGIQIKAESLRLLLSSNMNQARRHRLLRHDRYDFRLFVTLMCDVLQHQNRKTRRPCCWPIQMVQMFRLPIDPDSEAKQYWDLFCLVLLLYCSFSVPYTIAFISAEEYPDGLTDSDTLIDSLFLFDMLLSFCTSYEEKGIIVRDWRKIVQNYLSTWFLPDLAGSFPLSQVLTLVAQQQSGFGSTNLFRILRFLRMLKLFRAIKLMSKLSKLKEKEGYEQFSNLIGIASASFLLMFVSHMLGCFYTLLLDPEAPTDWLRHYQPELADADNWVRYVAALYWAIITITTTGYGDITPVTASERLFIIFVALIGAVVFSYSVGSISVLVSQFSSADARFQTRLRNVFEYLQFREISSALQRQIRNYYAFSYRRFPALFEEDEVMHDLNEPLRLALLEELGKKAVDKLPIFQGLELELVGHLVSHMKPVNFVAEQKIYECGDYGTEMYFIVSGNVRLSHKTSQSLSGRSNTSESSGSQNKDAGTTQKPTKPTNGERLLGKGDIFGELAIFPKMMSPLRVESAVAVSATETYTLSVENLKEEPIGEIVRNMFEELCYLKYLNLEAQKNSQKFFSVDIAPPNRLEFTTSHLKKALLQSTELEVFVSAGGEDGSDIMKVLMKQTRSEATGSANDEDWRSISCLLSKHGELLYVTHEIDDLELKSPKSLGFVIPNRSTVRRLTSADFLEEGSFEDRTPFGLEVTVFSMNSHGIISKERKPCEISDEEPCRIFICTWSSQDHEELFQSLEKFCSQEHTFDESSHNKMITSSLLSDPAVDLSIDGIPYDSEGREIENEESFNWRSPERFCEQQMCEVQCFPNCFDLATGNTGLITDLDPDSDTAVEELSGCAGRDQSDQLQRELHGLQCNFQELLKEQENLLLHFRKISGYVSSADNRKNQQSLLNFCSNPAVPSDPPISEFTIPLLQSPCEGNLVSRGKLEIVYAQIRRNLGEIKEMMKFSSIAVISLKRPGPL